MSAEQNKELARRAIGIWSTGDVDAADEIYGPDYVNHQHHDPDDPRDLRSVEAMKQFVREFREGFSDFHDSIDLQLAEGDMVATRFTSTGTHRGAFMGIEPTDRELTWTGITIDRIADGMIVESWANWDVMGMMQQLDALSRTSQEERAGTETPTNRQGGTAHDQPRGGQGQRLLSKRSQAGGHGSAPPAGGRRTRRGHDLGTEGCGVVWGTRTSRNWVACG